MFNNKNNSQANRNVDTDPSRNIIAAGTVIKGDIQSDGNIRVDGTVIGTLNCKGKVVLGNTGRIEGEVICQNANLSGEAKVRITVSELLSLQSTAKLFGEIVTGKLGIEPGAIFSGTCKMGAAVSEKFPDSVKNSSDKNGETTRTYGAKPQAQLA